VKLERALHIPADLGNPSLYSEICYNDTCKGLGSQGSLPDYISDFRIGIGPI
jgi:hypothetical protein